MALTFTCSVCEVPFQSTLGSLDRRVQHVTLHRDPDGVQQSLNIEEDEDIARYCSMERRAIHEPAMIEALQIKNPYPKGSGSTAPCRRCGAPVDRTAPHLSFAWVTIEFDESEAVAKCVGDKGLAVLCKQCADADYAAVARRIRERMMPSA